MLFRGGHLCAVRDSGLLFAIPAAQMSSREFCQVYSPQRTRRMQRSCCPQIPSAPIYTDFLQSGKEGIETALPACFPYLICGNLRNRAGWDQRDRRKSCEGSSERVGVTSEFQIMKWSPASRVLAFLIQSSPRACCSVRCPQRIRPWERLRWGQRTLQLASDTDALQFYAVTILRFNESRETKPHFRNKPIPSRSMMAWQV